MAKKKKIAVVVGIIIIPFLAGMFLGFSYIMGSEIVEASTQLVTNETTEGVSENFWDSYGMDYEEFCDTYKIEKISLTSSFDGHTIPADYIYAQDKNRDTVIMVHGLGGNRYTNYPVAEFFLENGYNVITYDQRSSNENTAQRTTFGYWEKYDFIDCVEFVKQNAPQRKIGVWGTSYGGATAIMAVAYENTQDDIAFLILDCPVSSMEWMVEQEMSKMDMGIPLSYMTWCGSVVNKMKLGFSYTDVDAAKAAENITVPTLVINSEADEVTPYFMGKDIFDHLSAADKELWTVADSKHTEMWLDYHEQYCTRVMDLLETCK